MNAGEICAPGLRTVVLAAVSAALPDSAAACTQYGWTPSMLAATVDGKPYVPEPSGVSSIVTRAVPSGRAFPRMRSIHGGLASSDSV